MGFRINTNVAALNAHSIGVANNRALSSSLEKLSSGLRINKAADDASGMAIADSLRGQASALGQAIKNANDGIGIIQTADKAMDEQIKILDTIKTKATQAAQDGQTTETRKALQQDITKLMEELDNIAGTTSFNGQQLLSGRFTNKEFQIGAYSNTVIKASIGATSSDKIGSTRFETGKEVVASHGVTSLQEIQLTFKAPNGVFLPIVLSVIGSELIERVLFNGYKKRAKQKLSQIDPKIVAITASYGKTSIKNYLYQLLKDKFNSYKTPRSVNTLKGIVADINNNLPQNCEIYIVEAGARERGDIEEIAKFIEHQYAIIGKIGPQHLEYFKTIENIIETKNEIKLSPKLKKSISYKEIKDRIKNVKATLQGVEWDLELEEGSIHLFAPILGEFNSINISLAFLMAKEFGVDDSYLVRKVAKLSPIPHRLQKIEVGGKIIIDDSFNGNIEGMLSSIELVSQYEGRKVIITPGIVEANEELNRELAKRIDEVFDLVIVTGSLNRKVLCETIQKPNKIYLADKSKLEKVLLENTKTGDLILFSNDAPNFI